MAWYCTATTQRLRASMQYIAVNLAAALLFLIGTALIYATTGTLNMADLAVRIAAITPADIGLLKVGVAVLALAFLVKSAMWPLGFWLPTTYAAASPPVAAMLVLMTKVGAYVILQLVSADFVQQTNATTFLATVSTDGAYSVEPTRNAPHPADKGKRA